MTRRPLTLWFTRSLPLAVLTLLLTAHCSLLTVRGQTATANLSGTIQDQDGAAIPGVQVTIENKGTTLKREATTNDDGSFTVPLLPPGNYVLTARRDGFMAVQLDELVLNVGDQKSLQIKLKVGNLNETVNITGEAPLINDSPAVGTIVNRQFVGNIPLNGRSFQSLIALTPGVVLTKAGTNPGQFSVNGQRGNANYFTIDGVGANIGIALGGSLSESAGGSLPGFNVAGGTSGLISVDALQEFSIQTSSYAPEFGRTPGGQISIISRSGTNDFHGSAFNYIRNDVFDSNNWFANATRQPKPPLRQNDFGFVFGGPVLLPRFGEGGRHLGYDGRNRTFFFLSYEGLRLRQPVTSTRLVPSLASRQNASIPGIRQILNAYSVPNGATFTNGFSEFTASYSNPITLNATSLRLDHSIGDKITIFGRYNYSPSQSSDRGTSGSTLNSITSINAKITTLTLGSTQMFSSRVTNDFRFNYSRTRAHNVVTLDNFGGAVLPPDKIFFPTFTSIEQGFFTWSITGGAGLFLGKNALNVQRQINVVNNLTVRAGNHQLKFGGDFRRLTPSNSNAGYAQTYIFTSMPNVISGTIAQAIISTSDDVGLLYNNLSLFGQDTWQVRPRLTLTAGLRWEVNTPPRGTDGNGLYTFSGLDRPELIVGAPVLAPKGTPLYQTTYNNFAPRFGISYLVNQRQGFETVMRGGLGTFFDLGTGIIGNLPSFPYRRTRTIVNGRYPLSDAQLALVPFSLTPGLSVFNAADPELVLPRTYQWNFAVEQSLGNSQTLTATYVGAAGRRLLRQETILNSPLILSLTRNTGFSSYNAFQLQFQRRLSAGFQALASYTWGHAIDNASTDLVSTVPGTILNPNLDKGPSDFDVRHSVSAALTYDIPWMKRNTFAKRIFSNWSVDSMLTARSATPVNVVYSATIPGFGSASLRPDLVEGIPLYINDPLAPAGRRINDTRITVPGNPNPQIGPFLRPVTVRQGSLGRNALRSFPMWQLDGAIRRTFKLSERLGLQFRAEAFNIFNHPNFGDPTSNLTSAVFGRATQTLNQSLGTGGVSGGFNPLYQIGGPRSFQFAIRLSF